MSGTALRIASLAPARLRVLARAPSRAAMPAQGRQRRRKRRAAAELFAAIARLKELERAEP